MSGHPSAQSDRTVPMDVKNTGFLLDRLGQDCHPLQFLRELTQNAIEAITRIGGTGEIFWDVDWVTFEQSNLMKLCVIDTGEGMSGADMVDHINRLSSSGAAQSLAGNYGVGAKIAAATRNHVGLVYLSWREGPGTMIHLWRDPRDGTYGLKQLARADGTFTEFIEVDDGAKPEQLSSHGTKIVLLGNSTEQNTMEAPSGIEGRSRWISKFLNSRYFRIPPGITIKAREGWDFPREDTARNKMRRVTGQEFYLSEHAVSSDRVTLSGAVAYWWILQDSAALTQDQNYINSAGHVSAIYQDELYELASGRAGRSRLQQFGIIFGTNRVVIYIEPTASGDLTTNTARTHLLINNEPLPWSDWANEFREKMPREIQKLIKEKAAEASDSDHARTIRERLKAILELYRVSRYRPLPSGDLVVDPQQLTRGGASSGRGRSGEKDGDGASGATGSGKSGNVYTLFEKKNGVPGQKVQPDPFPEVLWITVKNGTRISPDLEDRAARFLYDQNKLLVNADFRVFEDMIARFVKEYGGESLRPTVEEVARAWFEQALVETVIGIKALEGSKEWARDHILAALSEEALTAAVMQRYHVNNNVKRELGSKLGKLQSVN